MSTPEVLSYLALSDGAALEVEEYFTGTLRRRLRYPLPSARSPEGFAGIATRSITRSGLCVDIDPIHVHHLMFNDVTIADVARACGVPYVVTLHDYYLLCPTYTMLDEAGNPCMECRTGIPGPVAARCMERACQPETTLTAYQAESSAFLEGARELFVSNSSVAAVSERFPQLRVLDSCHRAWTLAS